MNISSFPTDLYGWLALFTFITVAYFVVRRSDINGIREANKDLRDRLDDKDRENRELQAQLDEFKIELAKLRGILEEKDKRIDVLSKVVVGTSPEMLAYMQDGRTFMTQMHQFMVDTNKTLASISTTAK